MILIKKQITDLVEEYKNEILCLEYKLNLKRINYINRHLDSIFNFGPFKKSEMELMSMFDNQRHTEYITILEYQTKIKKLQKELKDADFVYITLDEI